MDNKKVIGVAQVLQHLKDGMTRDEIAAHYNITMSECKILFKDERLKGRKTIKKPSFVLVDDETSEIPVVSAEEVETQEETTDKHTEEVEKTEEVAPPVEKKQFGEKFLKEDKKVEKTEEEQPQKEEKVAEGIDTNAPKATWD